MRFMMLMIPGGYQSALDAMPSAEAVQAMMQRGLAKRVESAIVPESPKPTRPRRKKSS
jgi:hypothetical protein